MFNLFRDRKRVHKRTVQMELWHDASCDGGIREADAELMAERLIAALPDHYGLVLEGACRGMEYEEMAEALGEKEGTIRSRLNRARHLARKAA